MKYKDSSGKDYSGFIEFFIKENQEYYPDAIKLNCARQGINYIIKANQYKKILIPYYLCDTVYKALDIDYEFYYLDENLFPKINALPAHDVAILYPNYFGTNDSKVLDVLSKYKNVIVDNTQAFFQKISGADIVYSPRKFFGVTDGAYVYCSKSYDIELEQDYSYHRIIPLFKRIELGANSAYQDSLKNEEDITNSGMKKMSILTQKILASVDYEAVAQTRINNFDYLHSKLFKLNELKLDSNSKPPMTYPFLINKKGLREKLISNRVYVPQWWKTAIDMVPKDSLEYYLSENLIPLPIDQRYTKEDLDFIVSFLD